MEESTDEEEGREAKEARTAKKVSEAGTEQHELTHTPFRYIFFKYFGSNLSTPPS